MNFLTKTMTVVTILASTAAANSAFAQTFEASNVLEDLENDWTLKNMPVQNQSLLLTTSTEDVSNQFTPVPQDNSELMTKIKGQTYSRFDYTDIKYPLLGPINFVVDRDYQEDFVPNNSIKTDNIVYQSPESTNYEQTPYRVATTAKAQVKFTF